MILKKIDTHEKVNLFTIDNFLNDDECNHLIKLIDEKSERSKVSGGKDGWNVSDYRTSSTATLPTDNEIVKSIDNKIHEATGIDKNLGEHIQGQKYEVGQQFKMHTDYFDKGTPDYDIHTKDKGQRTMTFMIYLNDVEEGGETEFHNLELKFKPKKGQAVVWHNIDENFNENPDTIHSGLPVINGTKYIITKWFRTGITDKNEEVNIQESIQWKPNNNTNTETTVTDIASVEKTEEKEVPCKTCGDNKVSVYDFRSIDSNEEKYLVSNKKSNKIFFKSSEELPKVSTAGFEVLQIPNNLWNKLQDIYQLIKHTETPELNLGDFIVSDKNHAANIMSMDHIHHLKNFLHNEFKQIHEEWSSCKLEPATFYGIRSYLDGAQLIMHKDRPEELHVSSILHIDEDVNEPWPLHIKGHDGHLYKIRTKPGQMILYESALCEHGRPEVMNGNFFRNAFIHYKLKNYELVK